MSAVYQRSLKFRNISVNIIVILSMLLSNGIGAHKAKATQGQAFNISGQPHQAPRQADRPEFPRPEPRLGTRPSQGLPSGEQSTDPNTAVGAPLMLVENVGQFDKREEFRVLGTEGIVRLTTGAIWITVMDDFSCPWKYGRKTKK